MPVSIENRLATQQLKTRRWAGGEDVSWSDDDVWREFWKTKRDALFGYKMIKHAMALCLMKNCYEDQAYGSMFCAKHNNKGYRPEHCLARSQLIHTTMKYPDDFIKKNYTWN